jgi:hypothetical protein
MAKYQRDTVKCIRNAVEREVKGLEEKFNSTFSIESCRYSGGEVYIKIKGLLNGAKSKEVRDYEGVREFYGLPPIGTKFKYADVEYWTCGWNRRAHKYKVIIANETGRYRLGVEEVKRALAEEAKSE